MYKAVPVQYQFDQFILDTELPALTAAGQPVALSAREMALLVYLMKSGTEIVGHTTLLAELWPDRVVTQQSIARLVADLRRSLKQAGLQGPVIETCHGQGYRLAPALAGRRAEIHQAPEPAVAKRTSRWRGIGALALLLVLPVVAALAYYALQPDPVQFSEAHAIEGRILWVDDHPDNNQMEVDQLRAEGYGVHQVTDTDDVMTLLGIYHFDLVISDVGRDGNPLAGFDMLADLRAQDRQLPVLFYTLVVNPPFLAEVERLGGQGAADSPDGLYQQVRQLLTH